MALDFVFGAMASHHGWYFLTKKIPRFSSKIEYPRIVFIFFYHLIYKETDATSIRWPFKSSKNENLFNASK